MMQTFRRITLAITVDVPVDRIARIAEAGLPARGDSGDGGAAGVAARDWLRERFASSRYNDPYGALDLLINDAKVASVGEPYEVEEKPYVVDESRLKALEDRVREIQEGGKRVRLL
jgi:hypothetical protein